jgi:hypothetical protein
LPNRTTLVFFSNGNDLDRNGAAPAGCAGWLEHVARVRSEDLNVVVRLHPNEDGSLYGDCSHVHVTRDSIDLQTTLAAADAVGSLCSTVLYEALLFGKPVWQFHSDGWPELASNWRRGLATRISSASALEAACDSLANAPMGSSGDPQLLERVFANHGSAADEISRFIREDIAGSSTAWRRG